MIVVMQAGAAEAQVREVEGALREWGYEIHPIYGTERTVIAAVGTPTQDEAHVADQIEALPAVERAVLILKPYRFASREYRPEKSVVKVGLATSSGVRVSPEPWSEAAAIASTKASGSIGITMCR